VDLDYDNLLEFCNYCNCIGHSQGNCKKAKADNIKVEKDKQKVPKKNPLQGQKQDYVMSRDNRKNTKGADTGKTRMETILDKEIAADNLQNKENEVGTSGAQQKNGHEINISDAINSDANSMQSPTASEFVAATKSGIEEEEDIEHLAEVSKPVTPQSEHKSGETEKITTPERIANDMQFLQHSWANLVDQELAK